MSRSKSLGRERSTTVSHAHQHQLRTPPNQAINVERAQKLAEVFGVPDNGSADYPPSQMAGVGLRSVRNRSDANNAAVPRERLASLAYMLDHDRNSLYDLLSSVAAAADPDDSAKDDEDEPRSPLDWPYERPTATPTTATTEHERRRTMSTKSSKPRGPRPRPDTPSPRHSTTTSESLTLAKTPSATDAPMEPLTSPVQNPPSRTTSIFRRPSMPSLRRDAAKTFVPPTEWESKAPFAPPVPSPAVASGLARRPSFSASATNLALKGSSSSKDSGTKLRKVAPPPKEKDDKSEKGKDKDAKKRRATTLARFFGIGYQDLFAAMLSFPSPGDTAPTSSHSRSMPATAAEPSPAIPPPPRPTKSPRRSKSMRLREAAAAEDAPPLPNSNGVMASSPSSSASRGRDPAVAPLEKPTVRRGSGMPFADTWRSSEERTSGESGSSSASRSKPPPRMTAVTVVVGGNRSHRANFNDGGDDDIMNVLSKLRKL